MGDDDTFILSPDYHIIIRNDRMHLINTDSGNQVSLPFEIAMKIMAAAKLCREVNGEGGVKMAINMTFEMPPMVLNLADYRTENQAEMPKPRFR